MHSMSSSLNSPPNLRARGSDGKGVPCPSRAVLADDDGERIYGMQPRKGWMENKFT